MGTVLRVLSGEERPGDSVRRAGARRVLVVDDEPDICDGLESLITMMTDMEVDTALSGKEALAIIRESAPDLVLTDYRMPVMNGLELIKTVHRENPDVSVVFMTAYPEPSVCQAAIDAGAKMCLIKPFEPQELLQVVEAYA